MSTTVLDARNRNLMSNPPITDYNNSIGGGTMPVYTVFIHKNEDGVGYWAKCPMGNGCAFTDGDTVYETERNMYESVALYLQDDYPDGIVFSLSFVVANG